MKRLIRLAGTAKPYVDVMGCLVELVDAHPVETFEVFGIWVNVDQVERRLILRRSESARTILRTALANHGTSEGARVLLDRLGADGYLRFRDLLKESRVDAES